MGTRLGLRCPDTPEIAIELDTPGLDDLRRQLLTWLPRSCTMLHSRRSGYELFLTLPPLGPTCDLSAYMRPTVDQGDVFVLTFPPHYRDAPPVDVFDSSEGYTHLGVAYDQGARPATPVGYVDVAVVGHVVSSLSDLCRVGESMRLAGARQFMLQVIDSSS